jgi:hypothetical protein
MEAFKDVVDNNKVNFLALICAICKAQFTKVLPYYGYKMDMVGGVHQLVSTAIELPGLGAGPETVEQAGAEE